MSDKPLTATIVVATHKKYRMPSDPLYLPIHVGAEGKKDAKGNPLDFGYQKDNEGDNISLKNPRYCELTGIYWAWKNLDSDYIGLVHYRRYFGGRNKGKDMFDHVLTGKELQPLLGKYEVFVPKPQHYFIETLYSHYAHTHYAEHLDATRAILSERYPEYLESYDKVLDQTHGYMFNMIIMDRAHFNIYCTWLFDILEELETRIDDSLLDAFEGRLYGRISEIIFNVWLDRQIETGAISTSSIKVLPLVYIEKVDWVKKGVSFLKAKFFHKKYNESF